MSRHGNWMPSRRSAVWALLLLVPVPSIGVLVALFGPRNDAGSATPLAQGVWVASKMWILLFPLFWHRIVDGQRPRIPRPTGTGMPAALATGVLFFVVITATYYTVGRAWIDADTAGERIAETGLDKPWLYLLMAAYWCTINSLLEEYVWRWFVFTRCEAILPRYVAAAAAGFFFTIHHTVAMSVFFGDVKTVVLASLGIWIAGATWSWIYLRWRNIYAAWVSHLFADLAIFWIGYRLIFGSG